MADNPIKLTDELKEIVQIGLVVPDLEVAKKNMLEVFGLEPDAEGDYLYKGCFYKNSDEPIDAPVLSAFYNFFNVQIELLQPNGEQDTIWSDWLKLGHYGLHHIRFDVDRHDEVTEAMADKGIGIWMEGASLVTPGARFTYYDSLEKLGFITEVVTRTK